MHFILRCLPTLLLFTAPYSAMAFANAQFDAVVANGRVMDPESSFDQIADVGIKDGKIVAISSKPLTAAIRIDAAGQVVAPGFVDLHAHGQQQEAQLYQAHDGVTTAIDFETGALPIQPYLKAMSGKSLINFGAAASHRCARVQVLTGISCEGHWAANPEAFRASKTILTTGRLGLSGPATAAQRVEIVKLLRDAIEAGAIGFGVGIEYTPGAGREEIYDMFKMAAEIHAPVDVHVRRRTLDAATGVPIAVVQEIIADAAATGASLHIAHLHSTGLDDTPVLIDMVSGARARGVDVTSEAYPYAAGSTTLGSEFFSEGWQERSNITYSDVQWTATGERLTEESFNNYRKTQPTGLVILHMIPEKSVDLAIRAPDFLIASDGQPWFTSGEHPRGAGTFSRVLGRYVREQHKLSLMEALRKMTLLPATRLEMIAPAMRMKGRIKVGADADIVVFDPARVIDTATYEKPKQFSRGISHVLVGGVAVVRNGETVSGAFPGKAITSLGSRTFR